MVISLVHEIFVLSNDAFMFMDAVVEWNYDRPNFAMTNKLTVSFRGNL